MPNPHNPQAVNNPVLDEFFNNMLGGSGRAATQIEVEILEALKRIEAKLSAPQSVILTGAEVERVFKSLAKWEGK